MCGNSREHPLNSVEDTFLNIHALCKCLLFIFENTTADELLVLKSEMVTLLYMMSEEVDDGLHCLEGELRALNHPQPAPDPVPEPA